MPDGIMMQMQQVNVVARVDEYWPPQLLFSFPWLSSEMKKKSQNIYLFHLIFHLCISSIFVILVF